MVLEVKVHGNVTHEQTPSIKLIKGQKDTYGWEIKVSNQDPDTALQQLKQTNEKLRKEFCSDGGGK